MTQGVLDLIQAIQAGDSEAIDAAFNAEMAERVSIRIDGMREGVAKSMFDEACGSKKKMKEEESCDSEEDDEDEDEKITKEELENFISSEGFAELSEEDQQVLKDHAAQLSAE